MLIQPILRVSLILAVCFISLASLQAQNDCNCNQRVIVQVDAQCRYILRKTDLGIKNCPDSYISVQDNKAQNRDTIDAPGTYVYGLYQNDGRLICQGNVMAMAPLGPVLDSVRYTHDTLSFQSLDLVFNQANTTGVPGSNLSLGASNIRLTYDGRFVNLVKDEVPNLGIPFFSMGCQTPCGITLSFSDELVYSACRDAQISNLYATIRRSWIARDCQARIKSSVQFIHFKNPEKRDFAWNLSPSPARELTLYYGECSLNPNAGVLNQIFPITSQKRVSVPLSGLKISQAIQEKTDTACGGTGRKLIRNYLIYDECRNLIIDTFRIILAPGKVNANWISVPADTLVLPAQAKLCKVVLPLQSNAKLLELFKAKIKLACKEQYFDWTLERQVNRQANQWVSVPRLVRDSLNLNLGYARITLTILDSCQNLYTKRLYILVKDSSRFEFNCPKPFEGTFESKNGQPYFLVTSLESSPKTAQCRTYSRSYRRVIAADCLPNFLGNTNYDLDQDGDVAEHFSRISTGEFAGQYYSPWVGFMEAFACDNGRSIQYEQRAQAVEEDLEYICRSSFKVNKQKPVVFSLPEITVKLGTQLCVPVQASGLSNILGLQFITKYDPTVLRYESIKSIPLGPGVGNFGTPNPNARPYASLIMSWVVPNVKPLTFPDPATLFEVCFTPLKVGESPIWVDTNSIHEVIFENGINPVAIHSKVGKIKVLDKNGFQQPIGHQQDVLPLIGSTVVEKKIPEVRVFPNPSGGIVNIAFPDSFLPEGVIKIKDTQGRILQTEVIRHNSLQMNVSNVPNGILLVEFSTLEKTWVEKIVLLRQ